MTRHLRGPACLTTLLALVVGNSYADITIVQPGAANHVHSSNCPAADGGNVLVPDPVLHVAAGGPPGMIAELQGGDTAFPGWTFQAGPALSGTLNIDIYRSQFDGAHNSGGYIDARYTRAAGDPTNLRWIQMISTNRPATGATAPYIDPYPNDDARPFYWTESEDTNHSNGSNSFGTFDKFFHDFSHRQHPPTSNAGWTGYLVLASWDGNTPGTVTIHDGVQWGWFGGCTAPPPPPSAPAVSNWALLGLSLLLVAAATLGIRRRTTAES